MKNKIKYFILYPLVILLIISAVTNVNLIALGTKVIFGTSYWKDSLSNGISTNKSIYLGSGDSLYYNGITVTSGTGGGGSGDVVKANENVFTNYNYFQNGTYFTDSVNVTGAILKADSIKLKTTKLFTASNVNFNYENSFEWWTVNGSNQLASLDSANGFYLYLGHYTGDGSGLTALNGSNISTGTIPHARLPLDTAKIIFTDRGGKSISSVITWLISPIFSVVIDFANGITTTTLTSSSTVTHNGDVIYNGWTEQGGAIIRDRYFRDTVLRATMGGGVSTTVSVAHGISNINSVVFFDCSVKDDSSGKVIKAGTTSILGVPQTLTAPYIDATNINLRISATMTSLDDAVDTAKFYIRYTDYAR